MSYLIGETSSYTINSKFRINRNDSATRFTYSIDLPDFNQYDRVCLLDAKFSHTYYQSLNFGRNGMNTFILTYQGNEYTVTVPIGNYNKHGIATILEEQITKIIPNSTVRFPLEVEGRQQGKLKFTFHIPDTDTVTLKFFNHRVTPADITDSQLEAFNASLIIAFAPTPVNPLSKSEYANRLTDIRSKYIVDLMGFSDGTYSTPKPNAFVCYSLIQEDLGEHFRKLYNDNRISFEKTSTTLTMVPQSLIPASIVFDNVSMVTGRTVLLTGMYQREHNGVYDITFTPSMEFILTRNVNYNTDNDYTKGDTFEIFTGFNYFGTLWELEEDARLADAKRFFQVERNVIYSEKTPHTKIPSVLKIGTDLVYGNKGDYTLQVIDVGNQGEGFDDIIFQQNDILGNSKTLANKNRKVFNFYIENEDVELIDFNGSDVVFTILFFQHNQIALFQLEEIKLQNFEKLNKTKKLIEQEIQKREKQTLKDNKQKSEDLIKRQEDDFQKNIAKINNPVTS